jgi:plastocyanin
VSAAVLAALALGLSACGSDSSSADAPAATTTPPAATAPTDTAPETAAPAAGATDLAVDADPGGQLAFTQTSLSAPAGSVTLTLTNASAVPHNIAVKGQDAVSDTVQDGGTADITVDLPAGEYEYYCAVPGHEAAGMKGTLTVE